MRPRHLVASRTTETAHDVRATTASGRRVDDRQPPSASHRRAGSAGESAVRTTGVRTALSEATPADIRACSGCRAGAVRVRTGDGVARVARVGIARTSREYVVRLANVLACGRVCTDPQSAVNR